MDKAAAAAESISDADLLHANIYKYQNWELANEHAVLSTIRPAALVGVVGKLGFPRLVIGCIFS